MRLIPMLPALLLAACTARDPAPFEPDPTEVTQPRTQAPPPAAAEFAGVVTSRRSTMISAQVAAKIEKLAVRSGQLVHVGELIARLERHDLETRLAEAISVEQGAQQEVAGYGAQASVAHRQMAAESKLERLGVSPPMAVASAAGQFHQAAANTGAAQARASKARVEREQAEQDLARTEIVAPFAGIVTDIKAHEGQGAQVGTQLARLFDPAALIIRFAVPRDQRDAIAVGARVELTVDGDGRRIAATVSSISQAQEPPINFTVVEADIDDTKLTPGQLAVAAVGRVRIADARGARP